MKILHYITDITSKDSKKNEVVLTMISATAKSAECHLMTIVTLPEDLDDMLRKEGVQVHYVKKACLKNPILYLTAKKKIKKLLNTVEPELLHIHGAWEHTAGVIEKIARKKNIATIISTHGEFNMDYINDGFWKKRLVPLLMYQIPMLRKCTCLLLLSEEEKKKVYSIVRKKRIEIICEETDVTKNNEEEKKEETKDSIQSTLHKEDYSTQLTSVYQKAIDSIYHLNITEEEKNFVKRMVILSVTGIDKPYEEKRKKKKKSEEEFVPLQDTLDSLNFRRISFYAYDEDVTTLMMEGARQKELSISSFIEAENIERYPNKKAKHRGSLEELDIKPRKIRLPENEKEELKSTLLIYRAYKLQIKGLTLRHLVELYKMFRYADFNEDIVGKELKYYGAKKFTKKLQKKMWNMFELQRGYDIF